MNHETFRVFTSVQDARDYRHEHGAGGWIFERGDENEIALVILFPPHMSPTTIMRHPFTRGMSGRLLANA
jgi:hypothetical protein